MTLHEYDALIAKIDRVDNPRQTLPGVVEREFEFKDAGNEGLATVLLFEGEPFAVFWYAWSLTQECLLRRLRDTFGEDWHLTYLRGGNGHYQAGLEQLTA
jgi:hypothetical protein